MKLNKKKELAAKALKVGKKRIILDVQRLEEIKEAITKQDMKDLAKAGIIKIKDKKGRKKTKKRKTRKKEGKIRKRVKKKKQEYVKITRKLRAYIAALRKESRINSEEYNDLRKKIRARTFKSKAQLKEYLEEK